MTDLELHEFYENLVQTLRSKGVLCAITGGQAYGPSGLTGHKPPC